MLGDPGLGKPSVTPAAMRLPHQPPTDGQGYRVQRSHGDGGRLPPRACHAAARANRTRRERIPAPTKPKPSSIRPQVAGSGTAAAAGALSA